MNISMTDIQQSFAISSDFNSSRGSSTNGETRIVDNEITASATWEHEELAQVKIRVLRGHKDSVKSCQFCANDSKILTGSYDGCILMWDVATGLVCHKYSGNNVSHLSKVRANCDASKFISTDWDKKVLQWDSETGKVLWRGRHGGMVMCGNYSHNDKLIVTCSDLDFTVCIWDSQNGTLVQQLKGLHTSTITSCYFNESDDRIFTTSMDSTAKVWDLKSNSNTVTLDLLSHHTLILFDRGHRNVVSDASCTRSERKLATVSWDKSIKVWDVSTGQYRSHGCSTIEKAHEGSISSCDFSPDGSMLVTGGYDTQVSLWDMESMVQQLRLQGHSDWIEDVCFSQDQRWILSASKDRTVRMWNIEKADNIPMVMETNKTLGLRLLNCIECGKAFSAAATSGSESSKICVFCRIAHQNQS